tara:strand:- start:288 stop:758 length:471 start_codon:yes stop_codon:yes gene_type:complete
MMVLSYILDALKKVARPKPKEVIGDVEDYCLTGSIFKKEEPANIDVPGAFSLSTWQCQTLQDHLDTLNAHIDEKDKHITAFKDEMMDKDWTISKQQEIITKYTELEETFGQVRTMWTDSLLKQGELESDNKYLGGLVMKYERNIFIKLARRFKWIQ